MLQQSKSAFLFEKKGDISGFPDSRNITRGGKYRVILTTWVKSGAFTRVGRIREEVPFIYKWDRAVDTNRNWLWAWMFIKFIAPVNRLALRWFTGSYKVTYYWGWTRCIFKAKGRERGDRYANNRMEVKCQNQCCESATTFFYDHFKEKNRKKHTTASLFVSIPSGTVFCALSICSPCERKQR